MRASTARAIAASASTSAGVERRAVAYVTASTAQQKTGYATTSVSRNDESTIQGTATATGADGLEIELSVGASVYQGDVIETSPDRPAEERLAKVHDALGQLIAWHEPKAMALEDLEHGRERGVQVQRGGERLADVDQRAELPDLAGRRAVGGDVRSARRRAETGAETSGQ